MKRVEHGDYKKPLYKLWANMRSRCKYKTIPMAHLYVNRGIFVCHEWKYSYLAFKKWALAHGYEPGLQIDRIDNDGPYSPVNCRFVTPRVNSNNKRNNRYLTAFGETKSLSEWSRDPRCKVKRMALEHRMWKLGWEDEEAISTPPRINQWK